jgi:cytochrome c peroxidase
MDYSLSSSSRSIFSKDIYTGQDIKGIFRRVQDTATLNEIARVGRLLFHDPILSGNNERSCASCHRADHFFADTLASAEQFDHHGSLPRNTPSLIDADYNHLLMADGQHTTLQAQAHAVITSPTEMGANEAEVLRKVMSCPDYRKAFTRLLRETPQEEQVTMEHLVSTLTFYYGRFSTASSLFDEAMAGDPSLDASARRGFDLFMSKAQCATCHFVPLFNGVKPPFIGSEFEVLGVPEDVAFMALSDDEGRFLVNPADETHRAFRTGSLRNSAHTAPYMHNGVFATLDEVIDFYDRGGGAGRGLDVANQTLSDAPLHLSIAEKADLRSFLLSLSEHVLPDSIPSTLPRSKDRALNTRRPGGTY